ncbi:MAG: hypothetical protein AAF525_13525, partial [Pseudomonadota bacterium]
TDHGFEDLLTNDLSTSLQISLGTDTIVVVSGKIINSSTLVTLEPESQLPISSQAHEVLDLDPNQWHILDSGRFIAQQPADIIVFGRMQPQSNSR